MKGLNSHDTKFGDNIKYVELKDCIEREGNLFTFAGYVDLNTTYVELDDRDKKVYIKLNFIPDYSNGEFFSIYKDENNSTEYDRCLDYIENIRNIKLFDYQKEILKCFLEGKPVITAKGCGRSFVAKLYGDYIAHLVDKNDYEAEDAVKIPWTEVILENELYSANFLKREKEVNLDLFNKEYELK